MTGSFMGAMGPLGCFGEKLKISRKGAKLAKDYSELMLDQSVPEQIDPKDTETLAAIDRGLEDVKAGRGCPSKMRDVSSMSGHAEGALQSIHDPSDTIPDQRHVEIDEQSKSFVS